MTPQDDDDFSAFLETLELPTVAPKPEPPKPVSKAASLDDEEGDDPTTFMEAAGLKRLRDVPDIMKPWMKYHTFTRIKTVEEVRRIVDECIARGSASLDLETTGLDNRIFYRSDGSPETVDKIVGFCISYDGIEGFYIPVRHNPEDGGPSLNVQPLQEVEAEITRLCRAAIPEGTPEDIAKDPLSYKCEPPKLVLYFWNAMFDHEFLYPVTGIDWWHPASFEDGMLASFSIYAGDKGIGLKPKSKQLLADPEGHPYEMIELKELFQKGMKIDFSSLSPDEPGVIRYAGSDAICTYKLCKLPELVPLCHKEHSGTYRLEKQTTCALRPMERSRVKVNRARIRELLNQQEKKRDALLKSIKEFALIKGVKLDPSSPKQLGEFLFGTSEGGLNISPKPEKNEASGQYKTDGETLETLAALPGASPILNQIVEYRGYEKTIGTYLESMANNPDENDELRFSFKQTGASTGRFSAPAGKPEHGYSGVPIHGIPAGSDLRRVFVARDGYTYAKCDYAGEELRIAANVSGESIWINEFLTGSGDLHTITARAFFGKQEVSKEERSAGKCVHPETLITVDGVLQPIKLLKFPDATDTFEYQQAGTVYTGSDCQPITATYNGGVKQLVHVVSSGGLLTCSENHLFKTRDGAFVRAVELEPGTLLEPVALPEAVDREYEPLRVSLWEGLPSSIYTLNHDWAYLAGLYAGDGTGSASSLSLTHGDAERVDAYGACYEAWIQILVQACAACGISTSKKDEKQLYLGSRVLVRLFQALDIHRKKSKAFRIPFWILRAGRQAILHYLGGLFDTDGTVGAGSPNLDFTTKDFIFAGQIATVLRYVGLDFNTELTFNKTYKRYYVRLRLPVEDSVVMKPYLRHPGKKARLRTQLQAGRKKDRFEVTHVLKAAEGPCVDLSVGGEHIYVANIFLTHNTANFALLYGGGPKSIVRATGCDEMEARRRKQAFDKAVPTFAKWIKVQHTNVKKVYGVRTAFGRWLLIPDAMSPDPAIRAACERHSVNFQIQGCLKYEARVLTDMGYIQIGELAEKKRPITVWTGTQWAKARAIDKGSCTLASIRLSDGTDIPCDTRHKLLVVTDTGYSWVNYEDLEPGMQIATSLCEPVEFNSKPLPLIKNKHNVHNHKPIKTPPDEDALWYWLGRYMGDGWLSEDGICYIFGKHEQKAANACVAFWRTLGVNASWKLKTHTPAEKEASRLVLNVYSHNLVDWLAAIGFTPANAHTKRVPEIVFRGSLAHRKEFIRGMMESDGAFSKNKGFHSIHLCQRPLLEDFKLLFRTVGVESRIRGPYQYRNKKTAKTTTSHRLDIQLRMYTQRMAGEATFKFASKVMNAPRFLIDELISQDPGTWNRKAFPDESSYILYRRIVTGGDTTVYTLKMLCEMLGVELSSPIYGFKTLLKKETLPQKAHTYTLSVDDLMHRFDALGVITKNSGADIMKISLVLLHKLFHKKGWLKNGGDDSVRMLLTVHDEIVFEIKHERVAEAIPLIVNIMESPWLMPTQPKWKVPLVVEPLVGLNWSSGFKVERAKKGHEPGKDEVLMNGFLYSSTRKPAKPNEVPDTGEVVDGKLFRLVAPPWLVGYKAEQADQEVVEKPTSEVAPDVAPDVASEVTIARQGEPVVSTEPTLEFGDDDETITFDDPKEPAVVVPPVLVPAAVPVAPAAVATIARQGETTSAAVNTGVVLISINQLNNRTAAQVFHFVKEAWDNSGAVLHMTDIVGETIIPVDWNLKVDAEQLKSYLSEYNLLQES